MMPIITDRIGTVVTRMRDNSWDAIFGQAFNGEAPYYLFGRRLEIANRLKEMENDSVRKYKKYPLVAMRLDIPEEFVGGGMFQFNLNIAILTYTDSNLYADERMAQTFKPKLYPLYERFLKELKASGLFYWDGQLDIPSHTKIDRPFWGTPDSPPAEGAGKYIFDDPLDAVELVNLKVRSRIKC